ncbi:membrane protein [Schistosoma japonicum]|nr:membrane protein [Schistosoma japonicum]
MIWFSLTTSSDFMNCNVFIYWENPVIFIEFDGILQRHQFGGILIYMILTLLENCCPGIKMSTGFGLLEPLFYFISHVRWAKVLYYIIIYGIVKPGDEYLDSFRYLHKKKILWRFFWKHIDDRWHLIGWIACNIVLCTILLLIAIIAWCNYLFHITMLIIQTLTLTWNGACFYLDYFPIEYTRNLQIEPNQGVIIISKNENHINNNETADERIIQDDVYNNVAASIFSCYPSPDESHSKVFHDENITIDEEKNLTGGSNITH